MSTAVEGSQSPKVTHHFGRGGAGNVTAKDAKSPSLAPQGTPTLKSEVYTTGRGGTGNMAKNEDPQEARLAQDVDVPGILLNEGKVHTGRGGAANVYKPTDEELLVAREKNEALRQESLNKKDRSGLRGLAEKGKEMFSSKN